jgi:glycerol-3-phosphate acyltransferase PlsY
MEVFMNVFLTVAEETPVIQKVWNVVDWLITRFDFSLGGAVAANIVGAVLCILIPYLLGSISPAILISRRICGADIRTVGRKTAGTYNMLLSCGKKMAMVSAVCEFFIGFAAVWFGRLIWEANGAGLALFFVVLGNLFPVFFRMQGGKGIVTILGSAAALHPIIALLLIVVFILSVLASKLVAFGSIAMAGLYPFFVKAFANDGLQMAMAVFVTLFVVWMHRHNYRRVQDGKEEKFYLSTYVKKKKAEGSDDGK